MRALPPLALALALFVVGCAGDGWKNVRKPSAPANAWDIAAAVESRQLENGLTVLIRERHGAPVITCELAFKVGAVDERDKERGIAHFLEHMLFKGSTSFKKGEIDQYTSKNGGQNNAWTSRDMTAYHFTMPSSGLDAALKILHEMLGQSTLDEKEFEAEKGPVLEELHAGQDDPWDRLWERSTAEVYSKHPYHHPVIGYEEEIKAMTQAQMKEFYDKYYKPANAVLVIVGDVDAEKTYAKVKEMFEMIPSGTPVPVLDVVEPAQEKEKRIETEEEVEVDRMIMAWRGPAVGQEDDYVCDILSSVLGTGRTARLYRRLVEKDQVASGADVSNYSGRFPGTFMVNVEALPGADRAKIEAAIEDEIAKLAAEGPTADELTKARNGTIAAFIFRAENSSSMANLLATYVCTLSLDELGGYVSRIERVTADAVKAAAKRILRRETRTVCWSIAKGDKDGVGGASEVKPVKDPRRRQKDGDERGGGVAGVKLTSAKRVVLDNGLILILLENHDLPVFALQTFCRASQLYESEDHAGLASLVGQLLEDGTADADGKPRRTAEDIAAAIENVGGRLSTSAIGVDASVVAKDQDLALDLAFDILQHAAFPEAWLEQRRQTTLAGIATKKDNPRELARDAYAETVYGRHPLHRPANGYEDTVKSITRDDCLAHFRKYFVPNNTTVAIVGDFDSAKVEARIRELTKSWKVGLLDFPEFAPAVKPAAGGAKGVPLPNAKQVNVFIGHLGIRRDDPDYFTLQVMDNVLGTGSGFTDRMSRTIRDEKGLVYAVSANISYSAGIEPGTFRAFFATTPAKYAMAKSMVLAEIDRIRTETVPAEELEAAKAYLTGSFALEMETNSQLADMLITVERYGLGFDYPEKYADRIRAVTAGQVLAAAKKHLDPKALWMVVSGPVDEKGELKK
ncbi:MAG: Zn-dependent [Planctomycetota bacterium]|nr:MAG: Zn-dependent [Planctomycetota bacterium]